ncbi:hypothetical protein GCM10022403_097410 [Streptomyces coacervatus]|uniref:Uncharacterized protein n=1 Tax=Streptomyces coacervatus TaxID=647381 RepID=A0ABP7JPV4_9ACTN
MHRDGRLLLEADGETAVALAAAWDAAFGVLRRISQGGSRKLSDVAAAVVERRGRGLERDLAALMN